LNLQEIFEILNQELFDRKIMRKTDKFGDTGKADRDGKTIDQKRVDRDDGRRRLDHL